jgi:hypothetical protein
MYSRSPSIGEMGIGVVGVVGGVEYDDQTNDGVGGGVTGTESAIVFFIGVFGDDDDDTAVTVDDSVGLNRRGKSRWI